MIHLPEDPDLSNGGSIVASGVTACTALKMKLKFYNGLCLLITLFYLLRPLLPWFEYIINKEYIEKNLCVGKSTRITAVTANATSGNS